MGKWRQSAGLTFQFIFLLFLQQLDKCPAALGQWPAVSQHRGLHYVLVGL